MSSIRKDKSEIKTLTEGIEFGCFRIMLELKGYTHFHFFGKDPVFYASTYFELLELIREKDAFEKRQQKKAEFESKNK